MSANAATWFYQQPERRPYMVTERLNGTFWQARVVGVYWRCVQAEAPYRAEGYQDDHLLVLEWVPAQWLRLVAPAGADITELTETLSKRILGITSVLAYSDSAGAQVYEWHRDGGSGRWQEIQGLAGFVSPRRLKM